MTPVDKDIIRRKLAIIVENLGALAPIGEMTRERYLQDIYTRKAAERLLQEVIEAAIDTNTYLLVQAGSGAPDDYDESFIKAGAHGVISLHLAEQLAPSAGLRNRLVHEYDLLDPGQVLGAVRMANALYPLYIRAIEEYLSGAR